VENRGANQQENLFFVNQSNPQKDKLRQLMSVFHSVSLLMVSEERGDCCF